MSTPKATGPRRPVRHGLPDALRETERALIAVEAYVETLRAALPVIDDLAWAQQRHSEGDVVRTRRMVWYLDEVGSRQAKDLLARVRKSAKAAAVDLGGAVFDWGRITAGDAPADTRGGERIPLAEEITWLEMALKRKKAELASLSKQAKKRRPSPKK